MWDIRPSKPGWAWDVGFRGRPHRLGNLEPVLGAASGLNDYMGWLGANFDPSIGYEPKRRNGPRSTDGVDKRIDHPVDWLREKLSDSSFV